MKNLLIFDIDGTLCDINQPVPNYLLETLQEVSKQHQIVLASGKPFGYIAGLIRQLGLHNCMAIGENGGTIMYSATFPPTSYYQIEVSTEVQKIFFEIKQQYSKKFAQTIWFQPNDVNLTVFPLDIEKIEQIHTFAKQFECDEINTYYHKDSVDFVPKGFDKGIAVDILLEKLNIDRENLYVFGDGSNDLPMLLKTKNSFLINAKLDGFEPKEYFDNYEMLNSFLKKEFLLLKNIIGVCYWITTKCNLRCDICYADLNSEKDNTTDGYIKIINKMADFNIKKIAFTGGDPLLVKNLDTLLKKAKNLNIKVALTTNAILLDLKKLKEWEDLIDEISLPMDGYTEEVSFMHRTNNHNHNNVKKIIENSINFDIKMDVSTVVSKFNKNELFKILDFLIENKIYKWKCFQYSELDKPSNMNIDFKITDSEFEKIIEDINYRVIKYNYNIQIDFRKNNTSSINSYVNVLPNGKILLSSNNEYFSIGNIFQFDRVSDFIQELDKNNFSFINHYSRHFRDI